MKKRVSILHLLVLLLISCDSENFNDCFQSAGTIEQNIVEVPFFREIRIEDDVTLYLKQGIEQKVIIETGSNLRNDVTSVVENGILVIKDHNRCNFVRDFGITKVFVTTPDLTKIRNSSEFDVIGQGLLQFPNLRLVSNTTEGIEDTRKSGDFFLTLQCENLWIEANGFSGFYLEGFTEKASIAFEDEVPRLEARDLIINELNVFQRSANKMIVHPVKFIKGTIRGTGDIISVNRPPVIEVEQFYTGQLLFED